jgi:hypothetical protein
MFGTQGGTTSTLAEASPHQERYTSQDSLITSTQAPSSVGMSGYSDVVAYSTWVERMLFKGSWYISGFYKLLFGVILLALFIMIFIEIRRQHFLHILYGVLLLGIIALFMYINQSFY